MISGAASVSQMDTFSLLRTAGTLPPPHLSPSIPPPYPLHASEVTSHIPIWVFSECPGHPGRGVVSRSFSYEGKGQVQALKSRVQSLEAWAGTGGLACQNLTLGVGDGSCNACS